METVNDTGTTGAIENANRTSAIANVLRAAAHPVLAAKGEAASAAVVLQELSGKHTLTRMDTMVAMAGQSQQGQWSESDIKVALGEVKRTHNNVDTIKALQTFLDELEKAIHPKVRAHAVFLRDLCAAAWLCDTKDDAPCKVAFAREYHMTVRAFRRTMEAGLTFVDVADVITWARENDPALDLTKVLKRLGGIKDELAKFASDWPVPAFEAIEEYLAKVGKGDLARARKAKLEADEAIENRRLGAHKLAPVPAAVAARVAPVAAPAPSPVDAIAEALGEALPASSPMTAHVPNATEAAMAEMFPEAV